MFMRVSTHCTDFGFNSTYLLDINENYYLYIKKLYGNVDIYQYKKKLNKYSDISKLNKLIYTYDDEYLKRNNELIILSGFQLFSFFNMYNSLFDFYIQKVNDSEIIECNKQLYGNFFKLLNEDKKYYLNLTENT